MSLLSFLELSSIWMQMLTLILGCLVLAIGINFEVAPKIMFVPGEGPYKPFPIHFTRISVKQRSHLIPH